MQKISERKGKVLTQIMIGIAAVGFFTTVVMLIAGSQRLKDRDMQRVSDMNEFQKIFREYKEDHRVYPGGNNIILGGPGAQCLGTDGFGSMGSCGYSPYIREIPRDPSIQKNYIYNSTPGSYAVSFELEGSLNGMSGKNELGPIGINQ